MVLSLNRRVSFFDQASLPGLFILCCFARILFILSCAASNELARHSSPRNVAQMAAARRPLVVAMTMAAEAMRRLAQRVHFSADQFG